MVLTSCIKNGAYNHRELERALCLVIWPSKSISYILKGLYWGMCVSDISIYIFIKGQLPRKLQDF